MTTFMVRPPPAEPVTLQQAKTFLRVDGADEDALIAGLIAAARGYIEGETRCALVAQGWRAAVPASAAQGPVALAPGPVTAVTGVVIFDGDGVATSLSPEQWCLDRSSEPARVRLSAGPGRAARNGAEIDFDSGLGATAEAVPKPLVQALMMLVAHWYEHREASVLGVASAAVTQGVAALAAPYRAVRL